MLSNWQVNCICTVADKANMQTNAYAKEIHPYSYTLSHSRPSATQLVSPFVSPFLKLKLKLNTHIFTHRH